MEKDDSIQTVSDFIEEAKELYQTEKDNWERTHRRAREDQYFLSDNEDAQWNAQDISSRQHDGRPVVTIDQLGQFVHTVVNNIKMNTPTIDVIPLGNSDIETAKIYKGLIRQIQKESNAEYAYDNALESAVKCSLGYFKIDHDYVDDNSFEQKLIIEPVTDPTTVFLDWRSNKVDGSDAEYCFILTTMTEEAFEEKYPGKACESFTTKQEHYDEHRDHNEVIICEYYYLEKTPIQIGVRIDPMTGTQVKEEVRAELQYNAVRNTVKTTVKRVVMSGKDILEKSTFPGKYIPVIPVYGEISYIEGNRHLYSLIRRSKDAQRLYNYWRSTETELLMRQPQAPFMAAEGQVDDYMADWTNPEKAQVLRYKTIDAEGNAVPPPVRLPAPVMPTGIAQASLQCVDDIKATMGMYNASIGMQSNETSGVAIQNRKFQGDIATWHFGDNLLASIKHAGKVLISAIPVIYDTARVLNIVGDEEDVKTVGVNGIIVDGQEQHFDLTQGQYHVDVTTGAPFATQRQEFAQTLMDLVSKVPEVGQVGLDLMIENMDFPGAQALASRIKKILPPQLQGDDKATPEQAQLMQMQQAMEQAQQQIQALTQALQSKESKEQLEAQIEIAKVKIEQDRLALEKDKLYSDVLLRQQEIESKEPPAYEDSKEDNLLDAKAIAELNYLQSLANGGSVS